MEEYLLRQQKAFAVVNKTPGRMPYKEKQQEELASQINHIFKHEQFEMNIFYGQPGMGKRSLVQAAIDNSNFCDTIFYLEIDAEFTRTEYLFLNKIFNMIKAEDPFFKQFTYKGGEIKSNKKTKKMENQRILNMTLRRDHAANFLNKHYVLKENENDYNDGEDDETWNKYNGDAKEEEEEVESFKELDEQDANTMYSTLYDYFCFFKIILYIRNADIFTKAKRQSFIYNILEISRKKGCKGLIIFESQNLNFFEYLEKRNASRMNPKKFVFGDFSYDLEFMKIIQQTLEKGFPGNPNNNRFIDFLELDIIKQELNMFIFRDFSLSQMFALIASFLRQLTVDDMVFITSTKVKKFANTSNKKIAELIQKLRNADEELHGDFKIAMFDNNLCETEKIIMMIVRNYYSLYENKEKDKPIVPLIKVKNIENNIAALIKVNPQNAYKMTRELLHMSIENLQRIGMIKLSKKRLNLETLIMANIDPCFSDHIKEYQQEKFYVTAPALEVLDAK
jgi:Cdc6-like AAA superfamily ATPase